MLDKICRNRGKKHDYLVWYELYKILAIFIVAILIFSTLQLTLLSMVLSESHLSQIIELGFIKSE